jgi:polysaccharide chain length determinant protein (PEP-CTERM system associated)
MQNELRLIAYYWELFWRRPLVWLLPAVIISLAGTIYILSKPRTYTSEATIVVRSDSISPTLVQSTVTNERLHFIEQRVLARDNLVALAKKFNLFPGLRDTIPKSNLAAIVRSHIRLTSESPATTERSANYSTFKISFEGGDPQLVAAVTTEIVSMIVEENRRVRMSQASDATQFLEREVNTLSERLRGLDAKWDEFIRVNQNSLPSRQSAHLQEIQSTQQELAEVDTKSADLAGEIRILKAELELGRPLADATVRSRTEQLSTLKTQLAARLSVLSEVHPEIKTLRSRIASLEQEMAEASQNAENAQGDTTPVENLGPELGLIAEKIKSAEQQQASLAERRERLSAELSSLREVVTRMPEVEAEMLNLERQKEATQSNLDDMSAKLNTARIGERLEFEQQADQIEVLEPAEVPEYASGPGRKKMMLIVLVLAAGAGLAALVASDTMDKTIRGTFDISRALEGRPLVVVPYWTNYAPGGARKMLKGMFAGAILLVAAGSLTQQSPAPATGPKQPASLAETV